MEGCSGHRLLLVLHRRVLRLSRGVMSDLCGDGALALMLLPPPPPSCCELSRQCRAVMGTQSACVLRVTAGAANKQQRGNAGTIVTTVVLERHPHPHPHPHTAKKRKRKKVLGGNKRTREKAGAWMHITLDLLRGTLDPIT